RNETQRREARIGRPKKRASSERPRFRRTALNNGSLTVRPDHAATLNRTGRTTWLSPSAPPRRRPAALSRPSCAPSKPPASRRPAVGDGGTDPAGLSGFSPPLALPATAATGEQAQIERDATTDVLVAELRQIITDLRRGQEDLRQERDHWRAAHEREQAAHAATQQLLLPGPATAAERDAPATREGAPAPETPLKFWCW